jgi:hypothetical protein
VASAPPRPDGGASFYRGNLAEAGEFSFHSLMMNSRVCTALSQ